MGRAWRGVELGLGVPGRPDAAGARGTLADLGIDLRAQENVELDLEERPTKDPRAFCSPIEVPGRVVLVIKPQGGPDDWRALFHEAGHTEHFAHTDASLSPEERRLGDNAVTEGWAMLLEYLTTDPGLARAAARLPPPARVRRRRSGAAPLDRPPLLREAPLRARVPHGRGSDRAAAAVRRAALRRDEGRAGRAPTTSATSTTASTRRSTCARGRSRRSCGPTSGRASATPGSRAARPARCSASCGRRARSRPPTSCSARSRARRSSWPPSATGSARRSPRAEMPTSGFARRGDGRWSFSS